VSMLNSAAGLLGPYKVCVAFYREHGLLRIHVTCAYFARTGEGSPDTPIYNKWGSVFKVAMDTQRDPNAFKEVRNGRRRKSEWPETANPALGGSLSRRLYAFDGAGRCYLVLGHLIFIRSGVRSEDPCNHPVVHA
jgi:hypothetical protein